VIDCTSLIYNKDLLNKYKKSVPKTWEESIETAKYIINEEKKIGNDEIIGYNGVFPSKYKFKYKNLLFFFLLNYY